MNLKNDSVNVVLLGDWSKFYIQPDWVAANIFESPEIEIGVEGHGVEFRISYKKDNVVIKPEQTKIVFSSLDIKKETLGVLSKCVKNYLEKASTPNFIAYGFNCDYVDEEDTRLANVFDSISDAEAILALEYTIEATKVSRKIIKNGKTVSMDCYMEQLKTTIHFNEHHSDPQNDPLNISVDILLNFIGETQNIVKGLGYEIEVDQNE